MSDAKDTTIALNVWQKRSEPSAHPKATNYSKVGVAQRVPYLDCGFIEPALLAAIAKTAKDGQTTSKGLDGILITRVALGVDVLVVAAADTASAGKLEHSAEAKGVGLKRRRKSRSRGSKDAD